MLKPSPKTINTTLITTILVLFLSTFLFGVFAIVINSDVDMGRLKGKVLGIFFQSVTELSEGDIFRTYDDSAVYYIGPFGNRHLFVNKVTYDTWFDDFSGLKYVDQLTIDSLIVGNNITVKPGTNLVTFPNTNRVFAISPGPILREVVPSSGDSTIIKSLYGDNYKDIIITIQNGFENDYGNKGPALTTSSALPSGTLIQYEDSDGIYYLDNNEKRLFSNNSFTLNEMKNRHIRRLQQTIEFTSGDNITTKSFDLSSMLRGYRSASSDDTSYSGGGGAKKVTPNTDDATSSVVTPDCALSSAYWITSSVTEGSSARLTALSTNCDNGTPVTYIIKKKEALLGIDWLWPDSVSYIIEDNSFSTLWTAGLKQDDSSSTGNYYFIVTANSTSAESGLLEVTGVVTPAVCGNSATETGEECDDGNTTDGDGCSSTCTTEVIVTPTCDDGILNGDETDIDCGGSCDACVVVPANYTDSITQYGITWTFDGQYEYGQFANGDYWILGPVNITNIDPTPVGTGTSYRHGSMVNPIAGDDVQSYDGRGDRFDETKAISFPYTLQQSESLISSRSVPEDWNAVIDRPRRGRSMDAVVLTSLSTAPTEGSFRPPYSGTDKTIKFNKSQLDYSLLLELDPVASTPRLKQQVGDEQYNGYDIRMTGTSVERAFERVWLDHVSEYSQQHIHAYNNMPDYSSTMSELVGMAALMLNLDFSGEDDFADYGSNEAYKETLTVRLAQVGIDHFGVIQNGGEGHRSSNGGHNSGNKWPILFAGITLDDVDMKGIGERSGAYLYSNGYGPINPPPDYVNFSEDDQAFYVAQLDIDETNGPRWNPDPRADELIPYITEDIGLAEWGINHFIAPYNSNKHWTATYRTCCTNRFRAGYVLGAIMMNAKELWNNDALFDYQERYMEVTSDSGEFPGYRQADIFTEEIWDTYHNPDAPDCTLDTDCNDDLYCNGTELCLAGKCSTGTNPCSEDTYTCTTTTCNDTTDSCDISYDNTVCDDSDVCTDDVCIGSLGDVTTGCQITNNTASCNDGNTCTENDTCSLGACAGSDIVNCGLSTLEDGLVAHYPFEGDASDATSNGNDGTLYGDTVIDVGISGQGYLFNGTGNINIGSDSSLDNLTDFTYSAWINNTGEGPITRQAVMAKGSENQKSLLIWSTNDLYGDIGCADTSAVSRVTDGIPFNVWKHVVMTYSTSTRLISLYIDGTKATLATETACDGEMVDDSSFDMFFGDTAYSREFKGNIDEVRIYNRALSSDEVLELYNLHNIAYLPQPDNIGFFTRLAMGWFR